MSDDTAIAIEVFETFKIQDEGVDGIMFSNENPRRALFNFSAMHANRFDRWSWHYKEFLEGSETFYVFFKG